MAILNLFRPDYYFDNNLDSTFFGFWVWLGLAIILILVSMILNVKSHQWSYFSKQIVARSTQIGSIVGWVGLLWLFFRYEGIPYFTWRIWPALLFVYVIVAVWYLIRFIKIDYPARQAKRGSRADKDVYLKRVFKK